jgi:hypothetical protein
VCEAGELGCVGLREKQVAHVGEARGSKRGVTIHIRPSRQERPPYERCLLEVQ